MRITPLDIRHKEFNRSMRGYKDLEVDEFLDNVVEEFERVFNENIDYKERLEALEDKIQQYKNIEETLQKTLISAQEQAEELKHNAKKEADLILRDAELKSRSIITDSYAERQKVQRSVQNLKQKQGELRYQLRSLLDGYTRAIDQEEESILEEIDADALEAPIASPVIENESTAAAEPVTAPEPAATAEEAVMAKDAVEIGKPVGIDEAVSEELISGETSNAAAVPDVEEDVAYNDEPEEDDDLAAAIGESVGEDGEREPVSFPALHPQADEDDPFADVEIDSDEDSFKW